MRGVTVFLALALLPAFAPQPASAQTVPRFPIADSPIQLEGPVHWARPAYVDAAGEVVQSDLLEVLVQCRERD